MCLSALATRFYTLIRQYLVNMNHPTPLTRLVNIGRPTKIDDGPLMGDRAGMHALARLIRESMDADPSLSYQRIADLTNGAVSKQGVAIWANPTDEQLKGFPRPRNIRALATALHLPLPKVVAACVEALGLPTTNEMTSFARSLPPEVDDLPLDAQRYLRDMIRSVIAAHGPTISTSLSAEDEALVRKHAIDAEDAERIRNEFKRLNTDESLTESEVKSFKQYFLSVRPTRS